MSIPFSRLIKSTRSLCVLLTLFLHIATFFTARPQSPGTPVSDSIDLLLHEWDRQSAPAISVAVVQNGKAMYTRHYGMARIGQYVLNDSTTQFWVASVTKQFTAAAIFKLSLEKKLSLNDPVTKYIAGLPAIFSKVTIRQVIHHTSGMRDGFVLTALSKKSESAYTNENVLKYIKTQKEHSFPPGTRYEYNNSGYVLLATIVERVSGQGYAEFMKQALFDPLGMTSTFISGRFPDRPTVAEGYHLAEDSFQPGHFEGNTYGSTGMLTTLHDIVRWEQFLQDPGLHPSLKAIVPLLLQTGTLGNGKSIAYAGGLEKFSYKDMTVYEHFGADEGFKANMLYFPSQKLSVIGLTNNGSYHDLQRVLYKISDFLLPHKEQEAKQVSTFAGPDSVAFFFNPTVPEFLKLQFSNGGVGISSLPLGDPMPCLMRNDTIISSEPTPSMYVVRDKNTIQRLDEDYRHTDIFNRVNPPGNSDELLSYVGEYRSPEIETSYRVRQNGPVLQFEFLPVLAFDLYPITKTDFVFNYLGANFIQFTSDGLEFSREGCRKLVFKRR